MCFLTFSRGHYYTFSYATFYPSLVAAERSEAALGLTWLTISLVFPPCVILRESSSNSDNNAADSRGAAGFAFVGCIVTATGGKGKEKTCTCVVRFGGPFSPWM